MVTFDDVLEIQTQKHERELGKLKQNEFVLVYQYSPTSLHTVYVKEYDSSAKIVKCINSHGQTDQTDQFPKIELKDIVKLYRVTCSATDASTVPVPGMIL